ncbi:MAG: superoxide dismutase [Actinomycetia bacterium]|nr:superoxide dismutase [Actinomycetes bacterium]
MTHHPAAQPPGERRQELLAVVDSAQRAAGVLLARHRGDSEDARDLLLSFDNDRDLASGALLLAELTLGLYSQETGRDLETSVRDLNLNMESSFQ